LAATGRQLSAATVGACLTVSFLISMDSTTLSVIGPGIADSFDASLAQTQWIVNAFLLAISVGLVAGGSLAGRFGEAPMLRIGLGIFAAGALLVAVAPAMGVLLAGRALQGVGAAASVPAAIGLYRSCFAPARQAVAMAAYAGVSTAGGALGPIVAGALLEVISWRVVFVGFAAVAAGVVPALRSPARASAARVASLGGGGRPLIVVNVVFGLGLGAIVWALIRVGQRGWSDPGVVWGLAAGGVVVVGVIAAVARRRDAARRHGFDLGAASALVLVLVTGSISLLGTIFVLSAFLQEAQDRSPFAVGLALLPFLATAAVLMPVGGRLSAVWSPRTVLAVGLAIQIAGLLLLTRIGADSGPGAIGPALALFGAGDALTVPALFNGLLNSAPPERGALMGSINLCFNQLGGIIGVALLGSILAQSSLVDGTRRALWIAVLTNAVALVLTLLLGARLRTAPPDTLIPIAPPIGAATPEKIA
jgi:DHA2 family methylenomycin A resistance protein-like MFS transporter